MPVKLPRAHLDARFLLHDSHGRLGDDRVRHAHHDAVGHLFSEVANMLLHVAGVDLVAHRLDHPLLTPGQMQTRGVFVAKVAGV